MKLCFLGIHDYGCPIAQGRRDRSGNFRRTGPDRQSCVTCGVERECALFAEPMEGATEVELVEATE